MPLPDSPLAPGNAAIARASSAGRDRAAPSGRASSVSPVGAGAAVLAGGSGNDELESDDLSGAPARSSALSPSWYDGSLLSAPPFSAAALPRAPGKPALPPARHHSARQPLARGEARGGAASGRGATSSPARHELEPGRGAAEWGSAVGPRLHTAAMAPHAGGGHSAFPNASEHTRRLARRHVLAGSSPSDVAHGVATARDAALPTLARAQ